MTAAPEKLLAAWAGREPLAAPVARLGGYQGIGELTGLTLVAEVAGWRRFASARVHGVRLADPVGGSGQLGLEQLVKQLMPVLAQGHEQPPKGMHPSGNPA